MSRRESRAGRRGHGKVRAERAGNGASAAYPVSACTADNSTCQPVWRRVNRRERPSGGGAPPRRRPERGRPSELCVGAGPRRPNAESNRPKILKYRPRERTGRLSGGPPRRCGGGLLPRTRTSHLETPWPCARAELRPVGGRLYGDRVDGSTSSFTQSWNFPAASFLNVSACWSSPGVETMTSFCRPPRVRIRYVPFWLALTSRTTSEVSVIPSTERASIRTVGARRRGHAKNERKTFLIDRPGARSGRADDRVDRRRPSPASNRPSSSICGSRRADRGSPGLVLTPGPAQHLGQPCEPTSG